MPQELRQIQALIDKGLRETRELWPDIRKVYQWIHRAAAILANRGGANAQVVRGRFASLLGAVKRWHAQAGGLCGAIDHFLKITRSYWPGLFFCYDIESLERTNNDLEQFFGSWRWHERRATGRKSASRSVVLRGPACLSASLATRRNPFAAKDLATIDRKRWKKLRADLRQRRQVRQRCRAFRRNTKDYLASLTQKTIKSILPF